MSKLRIVMLVVYSLTLAVCLWSDFSHGIASMWAPIWATLGIVYAFGNQVQDWLE